MKKVQLNNNFPVIGILGGGQLAKMISTSAYALGVNVNVLVKKKPDALPALSHSAAEGNWDDPVVAVSFAQHVDIVTLENEFISPASLEAIESSGVPLIPSSSTIRLIQDKWHQKESMIKASIPVVPGRSVSSVGEIADFAAIHGWPVVLKRRHEGYDGKGNATVQSAHDVQPAWNRLSVNESGLYVEVFCPFQREIAVMVCRSVSGETVTYPVVDTIQHNHICHIVRAPSSIDEQLSRQARDIAVAAVEAVDGHGTMGVEMFVTKEQTILVNELAPRVHNSGHYTIEACHCSQFENHVRAILGWPLGSTGMISPTAVMINLIGTGEGPAVPSGLTEALKISGAHVHLYGKSKSAKGRKMGHVTALGNSVVDAESICKAAASKLQFGSLAPAN